MSRTVGLAVYWLLVAVPAGVGLWIGGGTPMVALIGGPVIGLIAVFAMRRRLTFGTLNGLDKDQRRRVGEAIRDGEAVDSPELAAPLAAHSSAILRALGTPRYLRIVGVVVLVCGVLIMVLNIVRDGSPGLLGVLATLGGLSSLVGSFTTRRLRERAVRAQQETESRWGDHSSPR